MVFIPLALIVAVAALAWSRAGRVLSLTTAGSALVAFVGAQLATMSGESLQERVDRSPLIGEHADLGEATRTMAFAVLVLVARRWSSAVRVPGAGRVRSLLAPRAVGLGVGTALVAMAALTTVWAIRAGHKGAEATRRDLPAQRAEHRGGGDDD